MPAKPFFDANVLVCAFAADDPRGRRAEALLVAGGVVTTQVLNEFVNVSRRKLRQEWQQIEAELEVLRTLLDPPLPLTVDLHEAAVTLAREHQFAFYDALLVAAAKKSGCRILYSEDMQHGQMIGPVAIRNPFV